MANCAAIPKNCGTGEGTPCCPTSYGASYNPSLPRYDCGQGKISPSAENFCCNHGDPKTVKYPGYDNIFMPGVCYKNKPDCDEWGKACCHGTGGSAASDVCGWRFAVCVDGEVKGEELVFPGDGW
jgi:hypothetical protein